MPACYNTATMIRVSRIDTDHAPLAVQEAQYPRPDTSAHADDEPDQHIERTLDSTANPVLDLLQI